MRIFFPFVVLLIFSCHNLEAQSLITESAIEERISFLASDAMKGRFPGTKEIRKCADFIRDNFRNAGIEPINKKYYQRFSATVKLDTGKHNSLTFGNFKGKLIRDYIPLPFSAQQVQLSAKVAFCGYGLHIVNDSVKIDDYEGVDVRGKWVLIFMGLPDHLNSLLSRNKDLSEYTKIQDAIEQGAAGIIFVNTKNEEEENLQPDELIRLRPGKKTILSIPIIQIKRNVADKMLEANNTTLQKTETDPKPLELKESLNVRVDVKPRRVKTANIIGVIRGSDPVLKDEYIVFGAHYDHLGMGGYGTGSLQPDSIAIHNGADDNASGVAAIMTVGAELARNRHLLKRSVIIVAFSAEEEGLLGSRFFVCNPPVPLNKIKVMINLDMVGHLNEEKELYIGGCGTFEQGVPLLDSLKNSSGLQVYVIPGGVGGSDHVSFYHENIAVLGMHTGGHPEYHTPSDDIDIINIPGQKKVCEFIYNTIRRISDLEGEIRFVEQN